MICAACALRPVLKFWLCTPFRFTKADNIKTTSLARSSEQRAIRAQILQQYPALEDYIDDIIPKKEQLTMCKWYVHRGVCSPSFCTRTPLCPTLSSTHMLLPCCDARSTDYVQIITDQAGELIFFQCRSGPFIPTLKFLHKYPDILPKYQVDRGAISFVLSGANIMAPGLTSPGGKMDDVPAEAVVAIMAEGKENALAIGITTMSTKQILSDNKGIAVENTHWLRDGLWAMPPITQ